MTTSFMLLPTTVTYINCLRPINKGFPIHVVSVHMMGNMMDHMMASQPGHVDNQTPAHCLSHMHS